MIDETRNTGFYSVLRIAMIEVIRAISFMIERLEVLVMKHRYTAELEQNYPNPFRPGTVIRYSLPQAEQINLSVYSISGQLVATLIEGQQDSGSYSIFFNGEGLPKGKYLYILRAGERYHSNVMTLT